MMRKTATILATLVMLPLLQGCVGYYAQSLNGHLEILQARQNVDDLRTDPDTPPALRSRMDVAADIRQFAIDELGLPDNKSYRTYVDLERDYVTIAVFAAPEFSLSPITRCFPVFGCVPYQAHFSRNAARNQVDTLREEGLDVHFSGVTAYSTLGWTPDPLLNTMFRFGDTQTAAVVFHELAHQQVYIGDDSGFNEAFAVAVEVEGVRAWLSARGDHAELRRYEERLKRRDDFVRLITQTRNELFQIYQKAMSDEIKRTAKAETIEILRARYQTTRNTRWGGFDGYDGWFEEPINNAKLAASGLYNDLVPDFLNLFEACGRDFPRFYEAAEHLAAMDRDVRRDALRRSTTCL